MQKRTYVIVLSIIAIVAVLIFWDVSSAKKTTNLVVSAAASLKDSLTAMQPDFEKNNPDIKLTFNFGSSGTLQQQIEQGSPADLFLSAGKKQMQTLVNKGLINSKDQRTFLANDLVLVVPADSQQTVASLQDLLSGQYKNLAIGIPETVPAGNYAKETLEYYKIYDQLVPKIVQGKDVTQVLTYVATGNADAGFVYRTDAMTTSKVKIALSIDPKSHDPIVYFEGIVKATQHRTAAARFYNYLNEQPATDQFMKNGFSLPSIS